MKAGAGGSFYRLLHLKWGDRARRKLNLGFLWGADPENVASGAITTLANKNMTKKSNHVLLIFLYLRNFCKIIMF